MLRVRLAHLLLSLSSRRRSQVVVRAALGALALLAAAAACTPSIGDKCQVSTDCSIQGDRLCDVSQPGGYCTQLNCRGNGCVDDTACVLFSSALPGCGFDDRSGPFGSRVARSFCMAPCDSNSDCRAGYVCADPRTYPWNAVILDDDQGRRTCLPVPREGQDGGVATTDDAGTAAVCGPAAPLLTPIDAGTASDAGGIPPLFPTDAGPDAADGG